MNRPQMNQTPNNRQPMNQAPMNQAPTNRSQTNRPHNGHDERSRLLYDIQSLNFAKVECALYLDTHPDCKSALDYFYDLCDNINEMTEKYEAEYGPLTHGGVQGDSWTWIEGPWPWQGGCGEKEV
ncbi:MAG: spore coat protein CotJB [Clostridia bacterium]|nr:spore coat protein CotJB [Clostridia bacterium]